MNQSPVPIATATRNLRAFAVITRLALWLVLAAWGLLALVLGALHLVIVPRINDWRPELEKWASATVGVTVRVGELRAQSATSAEHFLPAFMPVFELHDVRLFDPQGSVALQLPLVRAAPSLGSIWRLGFDQVVIDRPVLDVRRNLQGRIEVAGLDLSGSGSNDGAAADWFFSQPEFVIQGGTVRWTDDWRGQPPLSLGSVDFVARNTARTHRFQLQATPPPEWGERFSLSARLSEPLLRLRRAAPGGMRWQHWDGELYADFARVDVARLNATVDLSAWGVSVAAGHGGLRLWGDVNKGRIEGITADLALRDVQAQLGPRLPELALLEVDGRVAAQWDGRRMALATEDLRFLARDGHAWPGGHLRVEHHLAQAGRGATASLEADRVELASLAALITSLPLNTATHSLLNQLAPSGRMENLRLNWQGEAAQAPAAANPAAVAFEWPDLTQGAFQGKGRVVGLSLASLPNERLAPGGGHALPGRPGISGATVDFDLNRQGGQARLVIEQGALDLPGVFAESRMPLDRFAADASWRIVGERIEARLDKVQLSNADAEGTAQASWHTSDPAKAKSASRFPGVLDLTATLTRADATRVHRYLPLTVGMHARDYVRAAVRGGTSSRVDFRVKGELYEMPFDASGASGDFRIAAQLAGVDFAYVPTYLQTADDTPWPLLRGVKGELVLDRASLKLTGVESRLENAPGVRLSQAEIGVADLNHTSTLVVSARAQGPAGEVLGFLRNSPLHDMTGQALGQARMSGAADVQFRLRLPLHDVTATGVQGTLSLAGNDVQISPDSPLLARATGTVGFSESGFTVSGARAQLYGGDIRFEGSMRPDNKGVPQLQFQGQGTASAAGLRNADLGFVSRLFQSASGIAAYTARLGMRGGVPELLVTSSLQGMAVNLPAPLSKKAEDTLAMRYENKVLSVSGPPEREVARTDQLALVLGAPATPLVAVVYERDLSTAVPQVVRGSIAAGLASGESAPLPAEGVLANVHLELVDVDAWGKAFTQASVSTAAAGAGAAARVPAPALASSSLAYLPTTLAVRADVLSVQGRRFHGLVAGGSRVGDLWRANLDALELNGYVEYRESSAASAGSVFARLARLNLEPAAAADVEQLLQQPTSVPALDIAVDDLVVAGRRLGRTEIVAVNRGGNGEAREWRLNRLHLTVPEARLTATGNWAQIGAPGPGIALGQRRTALDLRLEIEDSGKLLARFGREGLVRGGKGVIEGQLGWLGSPLALHYASLGGQLNVGIESGQFLKVEPGAAKLLGVLSLQSLPRRLALDFRDVFSEGFAFDFVRGDATIEQGVARTNNLQMKGVNAAVLMEGSADITRERQDLKVVVVPEINAGTASLIATVINPAIGLGTFLAQFLLREPLQAAATQEFHISGSWADPQVDKVDRSAPKAAKGAPAKGLQ